MTIIFHSLTQPQKHSFSNPNQWKTLCSILGENNAITKASLCNPIPNDVMHCGTQAQKIQIQIKQTPLGQALAQYVIY